MGIAEWSIVGWIAFGIGMILAVWELARIRKDFQGGMTLAVGMTEAFANLVKKFDKDPEHDSVMDKLAKYAEIAVKAAEQLYQASRLPADARKSYVLDFVQKKAKELGLEWTDDVQAHFEVIIEAVVSELPESGNITVDDVKNIILRHPGILLEAMQALGVPTPAAEAPAETPAADATDTPQT